MLGRDFIEFRLSPERDPDGSRLQSLIAAHYACEHARGVREGVVHALALASLLLAPCVLWPDRFHHAYRAWALAAWAACAFGLVIAGLAEWICWRRRSLRLSELGEGATLAR